MSRPQLLFLHLGMQKTGTSYLQSIFWRNQAELARQGLDLVPDSKRGAFHLMLRVRDRFQPDLDPPAVAGALERFTRDLADAPGPRALLSQESLAACTPTQIKTLLDACGEREVHVVLTVRDLGRQLPSAWQQTLQSGASMEYGAYLTRLQRLIRNDSHESRRLHLDPPLVLARWAEHLPPEQIHVVTVPPRGGGPTLLLERYCHVLGVDPTRLETEVASSNTGLGRVQSEVLRRVNADLGPEVKRRQVYGDVGKRYFAVRVLGRQDGRRIKVPAEFEAWCRELSESHIAALTAARYSVEGDLGDLRSASSAFAEDEGDPHEREVAAAAVGALVAMLEERAEDRVAARQPAVAAGPLPVRASRRLLGRLLGRSRGRLRARGISH
ncbi:MAG: hypothetical protein JWO76_449 [Nocardioides sp.]|nr:hypothetical protein [Nocardioides sp.]